MVARELTKLHEELRAGSLAELADYFSSIPPRGELTVVLEGTGAPRPEPDRGEEALEAETELLAEGLTKTFVLHLQGGQPEQYLRGR